MRTELKGSHSSEPDREESRNPLFQFAKFIHLSANGGQPKEETVTVGEIEAALKKIELRRQALRGGARAKHNRPYSSTEKSQIYGDLKKKEKTLSTLLGLVEASDPSDPLVFGVNGSDFNPISGKQLSLEEIEWRRLVRKMMPEVWDHSSKDLVRNYFYYRLQGGEVGSFDTAYGRQIDEQGVEGFVAKVTSHFSRRSF